MSLINQMLRDLEARRAGVAGIDAHMVAGLGVARDPDPSRHGRHLAWFAVPLVVAVGALATLAPGPVSEAPRAPGFAASAESDSARPADSPVAREAGVGPPAPGAWQARPAYALKLADSLQVAVAPRRHAAVLPPELEAEARRLNAMLRDDPPAARAPLPLPAVESPATPPRAAPRRAEPRRERPPADGGSVEKIPTPATPTDRAQGLYRVAVASIEAGGDGEAELEGALAAWPAHVPARLLLAQRRAARGELEAAAALVEAGLREVPGEPGLAKLWARIRLEQGLVDDALAALAAATPAVAEDPEYHAFRAALLQRTGHDADAARLYRAVLAVAPSVGAWWVGLAISLERAGDAEAAADAYRRAVSSPGLADAVRGYAEARLATLAP